MFSINTNIQALTAQRYLALHTVAANRAAQRIASGHRINSAADDAAGLTTPWGCEPRSEASGRRCRTPRSA